MKREKPILTASSRPAGVVLFLLACGCFLLQWLPLFRNLKYSVLALFCLCGLVFLTFAVIYGKSYAFFKDGVEHRFFGVRFRKTAWTDVQSVDRLKTSERNGLSAGFLLTTVRGTPLSPDELRPTSRTPLELCFKKKGFWHEWLVGKHFFIQQFPPKREDEVLTVLTKYCGALDFDARQPPTQSSR